MIQIEFETLVSILCKQMANKIKFEYETLPFLLLILQSNNVKMFP